ncbi:MAG: hypothetical protein RR594_07235, partial [Clostridia bacterium]
KQIRTVIFMKRNLIIVLVLIIGACIAVLGYPALMYVLVNASTMRIYTMGIAIISVTLVAMLFLIGIIKTVSRPFAERVDGIEKKLVKVEKLEDVQTGTGIMQIAYTRVKAVTEDILYAHFLNLVRQGVFKLEVVEETQVTYITYGNMDGLERPLSSIENEIYIFNKNILDSLGEDKSLKEFRKIFRENKRNNAKFLAKIIKIADKTEKKNITKRSAAEAKSIFSSLYYLADNENAASLSLEQLEKAVVFCIGTNMYDDKISYCIDCIRNKQINGEQLTPFSLFILSRVFLDVKYRMKVLYTDYGFSDAVESIVCRRGSYV